MPRLSYASLLQGLPLHAVGPLHPKTELLDKRHVSCYTEVVEIIMPLCFFYLRLEIYKASRSKS
jgi:hypothetical protein